MQLRSAPSHATRHWWRSRVLLQSRLPAAFGAGTALGNTSPMALDGLEPLQGLEAGGLWLCAADQTHPSAPTRTISLRHPHQACSALPVALQRWVDEAHARGLRVLLDLPLQTPHAHPWADAHCAADIGPARPLCTEQDSCPTVHARLACALKSMGRAWPAWTLPSASQWQASDPRMLRLAAALQLSVRGTPVVCAPDLLRLQQTGNPAGAEPKPGEWGVDVYTQLLQWRKSQAALLHGSMKLLPLHTQLLAFVREYQGNKVLCVFNWSDRYVREPLQAECAKRTCLIAGSGLAGGRIVHQHLDCDPWGGFFAILHD